MADFISLKVEAVKTADIFYRPLLPLQAVQADSVMAGRKAAVEELVKAGVSTESPSGWDFPYNQSAGQYAWSDAFGCGYRAKSRLFR